MTYTDTAVLLLGIYALAYAGLSLRAWWIHGEWRRRGGRSL